MTDMQKLVHKLSTAKLFRKANIAYKCPKCQYASYLGENKYSCVLPYCEKLKKYGKIKEVEEITNEELSQLFYLNKEILQDKERLQQLENAATNTAVSVSGLPHASGISDKTAIAADIADLKNAIDINVKKSVAECARLTRYINTIEDSQVRQILNLRYACGYSWGKVASEIKGNTAESVRMIANRYLRKT